METIGHDLVVALTPMAVSFLVACGVRFLGFADEPWAKRLLSVLFDAAGAVKKGGPNAS